MLKATKDVLMGRREQLLLLHQSLFNGTVRERKKIQLLFGVWTLICFPFGKADSSMGRTKRTLVELCTYTFFLLNDPFTLQQPFQRHSGFTAISDTARNWKHVELNYFIQLLVLVHPKISTVVARSPNMVTQPHTTQYT